MKKMIVCLLVVSMIAALCGCGSAAQPEVTPAPTPSATPVPTPVPTPTPSPEPQWEPGTVIAGKAEIFYANYMRGDELSAVGQWGDYYIVSDGEMELLAETRYLRLETEEGFEAYEGYAESKTQVYASAHMYGEPAAELSLNDKVQVLDGKEDWLYIEWENGSGYTLAENINDHPQVYYDYGGGGGGGGADGGDIQLGYFPQKKPTVSLLSNYNGPEYTPFDACKASVLSDDTEVFVTVLDYGSDVRVVAEDEETCTLYLGDMMVEVARWMIRMADEEAQEEWTGYTDSKTIIYKDHKMTRPMAEMGINDTIKVLEQIGDFCVVEVNGEIGYVYVESVSEEKIPVYYDYGGGGGGGGDWTPPAL